MGHVLKKRIGARRMTMDVKAIAERLQRKVQERGRGYNEVKTFNRNDVKKK